MPRRYSTSKTKKRYDEKRVYETTIYPSIPLREDDMYVYVKEGDRLDLLAHKYYGDVNYWWILARANNLGKGSIHIEPGLQLRVPTNTVPIFNELERLNRNR